MIPFRQGQELRRERAATGGESGGLKRGTGDLIGGGESISPKGPRLTLRLINIKGERCWDNARKARSDIHSKNKGEGC